MTDIEIPEEYKEKSRQIEMLWEVFLETGENLDRVVLETRNFLEELGFSRTDAMNKIAQDHKHLKGFSLKSLYRMLPAEEKRHKAPPTPKTDNCQNDNYDIPPTKPNVVDVTPPPIEPEKPEPSTPPPQYDKPTDDLIKRENEMQLTEQLLREERTKNESLKDRLEQATSKVEELDGLTNEQAYKIQELSRKLTEATTQVIDIDDNPAGEVDKPTFEQHWNQLVDAECSFCHKITPLIIRHFISGKVVKWIDRDRYKQMYGMVPQQE